MIARSRPSLQFEVPAGQAGSVRVLAGPRLLAGLEHGSGLAAHRRRHGTGWPGDIPRARRSGADLAALIEAADVRGRGGGGFPFARKLRTALSTRGRRVVVVNAAEGEPASAKDSVLMLCAPHLVLDGAQAVAAAVRAVAIHVVVPGERQAVRDAVRAAVAERQHADPLPITVHEAEQRFVAGESSAVLELIAGRPNLPVTTSVPAAIKGLGGQPTLLSNAETYAQVAWLVAHGLDAYGELGTPTEPGTRVLTIGGDAPGATVVEVPHGTSLVDVLAACDAPTSTGLLLGGYHGAWLSSAAVATIEVSATSMADAGAAIGAGVILPLPPGACPVRRTASIVSYLAAESARRCGPCLFGLPALAEAMRDLALGTVTSDARLAQLANAVEGRGACHHPDGTTRSIRSLSSAFPHEVEAHLAGTCTIRAAVGV
jgi:NADH:ubiquinone oxidoreductase subunit F (NADH-binding)